jgi:hypothetical protein
MLSQGGAVAGTAIPGKRAAVAYASHIDDNAPPGERPYFEYILGTTADEQGQFRFERLPAGRYYLAITEYDNPRLEVERHVGVETYTRRRGGRWVKPIYSLTPHPLTLTLSHMGERELNALT